MVTRMKANYRNLLLQGNEWIDGSDEYGLILTDDLDSLLSCAILKQVKGWDVEQVMIFKYDKNQNFDAHGITKNATHEAIGVDLALTNGKCFDNHLTQFKWNGTSNPESINLNRIAGISRDKYYRKYNLSTVLLLWSLYDLPKEKLSDELMMLLIAIDGSFQGYYTEEKYVWIHKHWLVDVLDLPEFYECEKRHTKDEFKEIQKKYNIHKGYGKITLKNGYLSTDIDIERVNDVLGWDTDIVVELPTDGFKKKAIYRDCMRSIDDSTRSISNFSDDVFSYALTNKYTVNYSERIEEKCDIQKQVA